MESSNSSGRIGGAYSSELARPVQVQPESEEVARKGGQSIRSVEGGNYLANDGSRKPTNAGIAGRKTDQVVPQTPEFSECENLKKGERVSIFTQDLSEKEVIALGTVRWTGYLNNSEQLGIYVGIEMDQPYGNGRGTYNHVELFRTQEKHAALVPLSSVVKGELK
ncbi:CAP-Gly domain-containing protein [Endozoicomonas ascidiicola]|uniref:CAP-Gly domain-containing protein n=1 Tax=Endozoicomonas ascidiicola TaxID=1698521 RepID=UPI000ADC081F|nr:CAP-Gly domain-containing protein [Endozoicomonas ascidiicola]